MKRLAIECWVPLILWLVVIFFFSTDVFAASETARIIIPILRCFFPSLSFQELDLWHGVVRKFAHVTEYFVLSVFTYRSFKQEYADLTHAAVRTLWFVALAAGFDELHQRLTLFRAASPIDVGYDCLGAVWALWLITAYETRRLRAHSVL